MSGPGERLRMLAEWACSRSTMEQIVDPILSDLQIEYAAYSRESGWRRRRVLWRGYIAFWKALLLHAAVSVGRHSNPEKNPTFRRTVAYSSLGLLVFTCLLVLPPLFEGARWSGGADRARLTLYLIPQALPLSIPAGVCLGVLCAMRARAVAGRHLAAVLAVSLVATGFAWLMLEWGVPRANQGFRDLVISRVTDGRQVYIEPGLNELGLSRLGRRTDGEAVRHYHLLWALCFATIPLSVFALGMAGRIRGLVPAALLALTASLAYIALMFAFDNLSHGTLPQVIAAVWAPNAVLLGVGLMLLWREPALDKTSPRVGV
jgi:hypothetical protein